MSGRARRRGAYDGPAGGERACGGLVPDRF